MADLCEFHIMFVFIGNVLLILSTLNTLTFFDFILLKNSFCKIVLFSFPILD